MDATFSIESLGISQDELVDRVTSKIADQMLHRYVDEDGEFYEGEPTVFKRAVEKKTREAIDRAVESIAAKHVLPNIEKYIEDLCLQETNKWGEAKGKPVSFVEYLVGRAEAYITEPVDYDGKSKEESRMSFSARQTRISHLIHKHLHYQISQAIEQALGDLTSNVAKSLQETTRIKLEEAVKGLRVDTKIET